MHAFPRQSAPAARRRAGRGAREIDRPGRSSDHCPANITWRQVLPPSRVISRLPPVLEPGPAAAMGSTTPWVGVVNPRYVMEALPVSSAVCQVCPPSLERTIADPCAVVPVRKIELAPVLAIPPAPRIGARVPACAKVAPPSCETYR